MAFPVPKLAAGAALLGLGGLAGAAVAPPHERPAATAAATTAPEVRTEVVHRTVQIYRHPKHRRLRVSAATRRPGAAAAPAAPAAPAAAASAPLASHTSGAAASSTYASPPLATHTSGAAGTPTASSRALSTHTSGASHPTGSHPLATHTSGGGGARGSERERGDD